MKLAPPETEPRQASIPAAESEGATTVGGVTRRVVRLPREELDEFVMLTLDVD
jgi:hypothetical protein